MADIDLPASCPPELHKAAAAVRGWADANPIIKCVWFFGSRVRGNHRPDSDLDLAIALGEPDNSMYTAWFFTKQQWHAELQRLVPWPIDFQLVQQEHEQMQHNIRDSGALIFQRDGCDCALWV